jgi:hypothetical protein
MSQGIVLTTSGASFMATAGTMFPALPIKYALFSYDARIDSYVLPTSEITPISAVDTISAVGLGNNSQIIYNIDTLSTSAYTISNNEFLLYDPNQSGTSTITNNKYDGTSTITLLNGLPLANSISATSIVYNSPNWTTTGYTLVTGSNAVPTGYSNLRDKYFRVNSFAPISCAAGGLSSGLFKVLIDNQKGNFKFNKVLLYAVRILSGGIEDTSVDPVLVGIAYLNQPVIKSNDGSNLNFFEADIEVHFSANNYFGNVSYLSNNNFNYVGGEQLLWFDGKVAIGTSAVPGSWLGRAKLQITENNPAIPMIRITNDNNDSYVDTYLTETFYQNEQTVKSSKPVFYNHFETSGTDSKTFITLSLDSVNATRGINTSFHHPISGAINTGWQSEYSGYLETSYFRFDSNVMATFRSVNNTYSTLVLGMDSINYFEHPGKFLTVHGGTLLVGSTLLSGVNDINIPVLSANGYIMAGNIYSKNLLISEGNLSIGGNIYAYIGVNYLSRSHFLTSADFHCDVNVYGNITSNANVFTVNVGASSLVSAPSIWGTSNVLAGLGMAFEGPGGLITCQNLGVSTSAHFKGPVTFTSTISGNGNFTANSFIAKSGGFYELDRVNPNGYWQTSSPTIAVDSGALTATDSNYVRYTYMGGKTLIVNFFIQVRVTGSPVEISLVIPGGNVVESVIPYATCSGWGNISIAGGTEHCIVTTAPGTNTFSIYRNGNVAYPASTTIGIRGGIIIPLP